MRTFFRCGKLSFQPRLAEVEAISSSCEIKLLFLSGEVWKVWGYRNIITVIWWCIRGKRGRTGNAWNRLHSSITARNGWRFPTLRVMHEPTFLQEWTNEWTKDQFIQVNVVKFSQLANCNTINFQVNDVLGRNQNKQDDHVLAGNYTSLPKWSWRVVQSGLAPIQIDSCSATNSFNLLVLISLGHEPTLLLVGWSVAITRSPYGVSLISSSFIKWDLSLYTGN